MIQDEMKEIREYYEKKDFRFPFAEKIDKFLTSYSYNQWKKFKNQIMKYLTDAIRWVENERQKTPKNPNWFDLLEKLEEVHFKCEVNGMNPEQSKLRKQKSLERQLSLKEAQFKVLREQGLSDGQASAFYLPKILKLSKNLAKKLPKFEEKEKHWRDVLLQCQRNADKEGHTFTQTLRVTQDEINKFIAQFQGSFKEQLTQLTQIQLPKYENMRKEIESSNPLIFHVSNILYGDNCYGDRTVKGYITEKRDLIDFHTKQYLLTEYEKIELFLWFFLEHLLQIANFETEINVLLSDYWIYPFRLPYLKQIINCLVQCDYVGFFHITVPQIEGLLRDLLLYNQISIYKEKRMNEVTQQYYVAGEILSELRRHAILDSDFLILIEIYLFDPLHKNLRNHTLHGLIDYRTFTKYKLSVLFLILMKLVMMYEKNEQVKKHSPP